MVINPVEILHYSTADLPPDERYAAWLGRGWPRPDQIYRTERTEPFNTTFGSAVLGEIVFVHAAITGMRYERRIEEIRQSDFDPIIVNLMVAGVAQGDMAGRAFREDAGTILFHDLSKPSVHVSSASESFAIVAPRAVAGAAFGALDDLHGLVVAGPAAALLLAHAARTWAVLPELDAAAAPALGRTLLDRLVVALVQARPTPDAATAESALRRRANAEIERRLNKPITVAGLCEALSVSRARLFAAFRADGGVLARVFVMRLESARAALADLERAEPIGTIAERLGFSAASHLSRAFKERYGMSPRDYRRLVASDDAGTRGD